MAPDQKFEGWVGLNKDSAKGNLVWQEFEPKTFTDDDIDIEISHCGICGTDLHFLRSGFGPTDYPIVVGHEIVGKATRVGKNYANKVKVGDRVGVGAQSGSCLRNNCLQCENDTEQYCQNAQTTTYGSRWPSGEKSYGGYAKNWRGNGHFVIPIPDALDSAEAAPMLCGE